ncbi:patatin-like phospholipase family protein [Argonema antarcticum]|uniref:patatin-like phospholipase family protein n=1 Tax=Argonema antarcticum TaxID=2942763 RepID=UPI002011DF6B|nr:patatin-like phospholipase family protein [Argonema antarcticum]MCL1469236.1 patatin-like phospholipase family protein [Argonema antarcticum A004/B2]
MGTKFKRRILSIDGGGIRGIIPAIVLNYIEERTGKRIATMFDLIAGTSTGGILALGLTRKNSDSSINKEPEYTAVELVNFYRQHGKKIFTEQFPTDIDDLIQPKINPKGLQEVLTALLGEAKVEDAIKEIFITSYDIELRAPVFFTSNREAEDTNSFDSRKICTGFKMVEAARATSAAPTFFPPYKLETGRHRTSEGYYALIDGGVFANNPASLAMMEAMISYKRRNPGEELQRTDILVVSLGTGSLTTPYKYRDVKNWGQLKWGLPLLSVVLDSQSEAVAYQLSKLMVTRGENRNYYRFQLALSSDHNHDQLDNADPSNIDYLEMRGKKLIEEDRETLNELCELLKQDY